MPDYDTCERCVHAKRGPSGRIHCSKQRIEFDDKDADCIYYESSW